MNNKLLHRILWGTLLIVGSTLTVRSAEVPAVDLSTIDRSITKEPTYQFTPHYTLLVFGEEAKQASWLVIDGDGTQPNSAKVVYLDRNGNGDLTDPEDRSEMDVAATEKIRPGKDSSLSAMNVFQLGEVAGMRLRFQFWVRNPDHEPNSEWERKVLKERQENCWEIGTLWRDARRGGSAEIPTVLTLRREDAQITHLDGPLAVGLNWGEFRIMEPWPKQTVFDVRLGTPGLAPRNGRQEIFSPWTVNELPADRHPVAELEFPHKTPGKPPLIRELKLDQRCSGDRLCATVVSPSDAGVGPVKVRLTFSAWPEGNVPPAQFVIPMNTAISKHGEQSFVMFHNEQIELKAAVMALRKRRLDVSYQAEMVVVYETEMVVVVVDGEPLFVIRLGRGKDVQETATMLGVGTKHATQLSQCESRFEIMVGDYEKAMIQKEVLADVQSALQKLTRGIVYNTWNKELVGPR